MRSKKRTIGILSVSILCLLIGSIFARLYCIKVENDKLELMFSDDCLKDNMGRVEPNEKYYEIINSILGEDRQIGTLEDNICHYVAEKDDYAHDKETGTGYIDNEILIYTKDGVSRDNVENLAQKYNAEIVGQIKTINYYQLKFNTSYSLLKLKEICNKLEQESIVEHSTINYTYKISSSGINYGEQWKQENWSETNISGSNWGLEAIKAISAWEYMGQMNPVRIGLIDTGFDANTEVETDKEFQNLIEQEKIQETGHEDLEFSATYCNVPPAFLNADSHGTHVAGIIAANSDNSEGICGTYPYGKNNLYGVNVIGVAVKEEATLGQYQTCFAFLIEENNVKVINSSVVSGNCGNWFLQSEIYEDKDSKNEIKKISVEVATLLKKYINNGYDFVIVQAAGNESNNQYTRLKCDSNGNISYNKKGNCKYDEHGTIVKLDSSNFKIKNGFWKREFYYIDSNGIEHEIINMNTDKIIQSEFLESKYSSSLSAIDKEEFKDVYDRIIVVGAVGLSKNESTNATFYHIWEHSNLGERIDVVAPGDNIYSTIIGGYGYYSGTSMAAPYVSGTAAMVWSANNDLTGVQVKEIICRTANQRITSVNANSEFSKLPDNVVWYKMINAKLAVEEAIRRTDTLVVPIEDESQSTEFVEITEIPTEPETTTVDISYEGEYGNLRYLVKDGEVIITGCFMQDMTNVEIPSEIDGFPVTTIGNGAFYGENLVSISFPNSITKIKAGAFDYTPWLSKKREENPIVIENNILISWDKTKNETDVIIPDGVISIAGRVFKDYDMVSVTIPNSVVYIGDEAFSECYYLSNVIMSDSITEIGDKAFNSCTKLTSITIPNGTKSIGDYAFAGCEKLVDVTIADSIMSAGCYVFGGHFGETTPWLEEKRKENPIVVVGSVVIDGITCNGDVIIPDNVTEIAEEAFWGSELNSITFPDSIVKIGDSAFGNCKNLSSVVVPKNVEKIGASFIFCESLKEVTFLNPKCEIPISLTTIFNKAEGEGNYYTEWYYNGVIKGYKHSTAQEYAELCGYKFIEIEN